MTSDRLVANFYKLMADKPVFCRREVDVGVVGDLALLDLGLDLGHYALNV